MSLLTLGTLKKHFSKFTFAVSFFLNVFNCYSQNCGNNWLNVKGEISGVRIGDLDVTGNKLTVEATVNRTQAYDPSFYGGDIVSKHTDPTDANYLLRANRAEITTTNGFFVTPNTCGIELNKTYHLAMVYDGSFLKYYANGYLMSQVACTGNMANNNWLTAIGTTADLSSPYPADFLGYIDEVRIWNVARTQEELRQYQNNPLPNPTNQIGLLAYYSFNDTKNKQGNTTWNGKLLGNALIAENNPTCSFFIADSCGKITTPDPIVTVGFTIPDTFCVNTPVAIKNTTTGGSNFYWNFCVADINQIPVGTNLGNLGNQLASPVFIDLAQNDNGDYYGFSINHLTGQLIRYNFGNSYLNDPVVENLGNFNGAIPNQAEGVQIIKANGNWYVIVVGGGNYLPNSSPRIVVINFGNSLANNTTIANNWGNLGNLSQPIDLHVFKENGNWYGFTVNATNNTITRFDFLNNFEVAPTAVNLGGFGILNYPDGIYVINDNSYWRAFVTNSTTSSITRLDFGTSLLNVPTATDLGNPGNNLNNPRDILVVKFCGETVGFVVNATSNELTKLDFSTGLDKVPTSTSLGNTGNLSTPHSLSKLFRVGSDLYSFITNVGNNSITRLQFSGCTNSSIPNSTDSIPPQITYTTPGVYNINVMVDEGLSTQTSFCKSIVVVASPVKTPLFDTSFCEGDSVLLSTNFIEGTHVWNTGNTDTSIRVKTAGTYWIDNQYYGCSVRDSINVLANALPIVALGKDTSICNADSIILNAGSEGLSYLWQDGTTQQLYHADTSGIYNVVVTNSKGCIAKDTIKIDLYGSIALKLTADTTICYGNNILLSATGNNIKTYTWAPSPTLSNVTIPNPLATPVDTTIYFLSVTDNNGCKGIDSVLVNVAPLPQVATISDSAICTGTSIVLSTTGSSGNSYSWSPSTGLSDPNSANPKASPGIDTKYVVTGVSNLGCTAKDSVTVSLNPLPTITALGDTTVCPGANSQLTAVAPGSNIFTWYPSVALNDTTIANPVASPLQTTKYYVRVTDNNNCNNTDSVTISVVTKPVFRVQPNTVNICSGDSAMLVASGGNIFQWSPAETIASPTSSSTLVYPAQNTVYKVVITNNICNITDSVFATVNINARPNIQLSKSNDVDCVLGQSKLLATGGVQYLWSPAETLSNPDIANPVATPSATTVYHLLLTGASGCVIEDSVEVKVIKGAAENGYLMPSAFTPNGDGHNDCFGVKLWGAVTGLDFSIYNRWGNLIFHTTNPGDCWDGTYKGVRQQPGTFIYQVRAKTICGDVYRKGPVILIR
ncbi:MAG TPA: gliding motility-associated C-terminal domain-containing protein [Panacibacter sp.]|nr:gliding motility-associated C-terminal domain-containing protein [Panacibacter sp.]